MGNMLPASYGFSGPAARYETSLPLNKIGACEVTLFVFLRRRADYGFYAVTRSSLLLKTRKFVLSLNKAVSELQSNKKFLYRAKLNEGSNLNCSVLSTIPVNTIHISLLYRAILNIILNIQLIAQCFIIKIH